MKYQLANMNHIPFGDTYDTLEEAGEARVLEVQRLYKFLEEEHGHVYVNLFDYIHIVKVATKSNAQHGKIPKTETIHIRLTTNQKLELRRSAQAEGLTISAYILKTLGIDSFLYE